MNHILCLFIVQWDSLLVEAPGLSRVVVSQKYQTCIRYGSYTDTIIVILVWFISLFHKQWSSWPIISHALLHYICTAYTLPSVKMLHLHNRRWVISQTDQKMNVLADMGHLKLRNRLVKRFINAYVSVNVCLSKWQGIGAWLNSYPDCYPSKIKHTAWFVVLKSLQTKKKVYCNLPFLIFF